MILHIRGTRPRKLPSLSWREVLPPLLEPKAPDTRSAIPGGLPGLLVEGRQVAWVQPAASPPGFIAWLKIQPAPVLLPARGMAWTPTLRSPDRRFHFSPSCSVSEQPGVVSLGSSRGHPRLSRACPPCAECEALGCDHEEAALRLAHRGASPSNTAVFRVHCALCIAARVATHLSRGGTARWLRGLCGQPAPLPTPAHAGRSPPNLCSHFQRKGWPRPSLPVIL